MQQLGGWRFREQTHFLREYTEHNDYSGNGGIIFTDKLCSKMSSRMSAKLDQDEFQSYKAAFHAFDWNNNGKISSASLQVATWLCWCLTNYMISLPKAAMRRAGANPTDVEVLDIINRIDNETGYLDFPVSWKEEFGISELI